MRIFSIGRISAATALLALATAVAAGTSATPDELEQHKTGHAGQDVYGIVNLEGGDFAFIGDINGRGQAAFEYFGIDGQVHVGFFNGERVIDISPPNSRTALLGDLNDKGESASRQVSPNRRIREAARSGPSLDGGKPPDPLAFSRRHRR